MIDCNISCVDTKDPQACNTNDPVNYWQSSRDPVRTPFHWDSSTNASTAWLPVASNYRTVNVAAQKAATKNHYKFYKDVVALKHTSAVASGSLGTHAVSSDVLVVTSNGTEGHCGHVRLLCIAAQIVASFTLLISIAFIHAWV